MHYTQITSIKTTTLHFRPIQPAKVNSIDNQPFTPQNVGNNRQQIGNTRKHIPKMPVLMIIPRTQLT